jgi:glutamine synthetase
MIAGNVSRMTHPSLRQRLSPGDRYANARYQCAEAIEAAGITVHSHGHEDGLCQHEIALDPLPLCDAADAVQICKYLIKSVAQSRQMVATFVPKPLANEPGNGLHLSMSLMRDSRNLFFESANELAPSGLAFAEGVKKHVRALNALLNPTNNSYNRLETYFEPLRLGPKRGDRGAAIRIPSFSTADECRLEVRIADATCNPYLGLAALLLAGMDNPVSASQERSPSVNVPGVGFGMCRSLLEAIDALQVGHAFMTNAGVFSEDLIEVLLQLLRRHHATFSRYPNPAEFHAIF